MNASYFIQFARGDQLLATLPELSGAGLAENAFKVAPREEVVMTKAAIAGRVGHGSDSHQRWVKELAKRLTERRGEFLSYKKAVQPGLDSITGFNSRLEKFATEL
jgi:hypothetical protein